MKITLNWLRDYVAFEGSVEDLAERLTMLGLEVEGVESTGPGLDKVVVAEVRSRDTHPNADRLSLCRVFDGTTEHQIVCGADNFKAGDRVPLALPGARLPSPEGQPPFEIKVGKIRGVESRGMMCSPSELGVPGDPGGLLILPPDAPLGTPFAEFLGMEGPDTVLDLETTPNRPDWNAVTGIAREVAAVTRTHLRLPDPDLSNAPTTGPSCAESVRVRIQDPDLCPRYTARIVRGVRIGPSPEWLRSRLERVGVRSINNVVDITNYVMLELGQPLHAFDLHLLDKGQADLPGIVIRRAHPGETLVTLDGTERRLTGDHLVIADEQRPIALAGVMGGENSEIRDETRDILIESACFHPGNIRATSKHFDLRTDASYRFERGSDVEVCDLASRRAALLILELAGGQLAEGAVDAWPQPAPRREIRLRFARTNALLGIEIPHEQQIDHLRRLDLEIVSSDDTSVLTRIPAFRVDLKAEIDLVEEVVRLHGIDRIPATPPSGAVGSHPHDAVHDQIDLARGILTGLGLDETQGQTLIARSQAEWFLNEPVALSHPLSADMDVLRPSLLPGLLEALRRNGSHRIQDVALFEVGRVFDRGPEGPVEARRIALALTGRRTPAHWTAGTRADACDVFDLKGVVEDFLDHFGVAGLQYRRDTEPPAAFAESASIEQGRQSFGRIGQLSPRIGRRFDLRQPVFLAELDLDLLLARRKAVRTMKPLPAFPAVRRDVALSVDEAVSHDQILAAVRKARTPTLESIEIFDVFRGGNVPAGQKSVAYGLTYRAQDRTLQDEEVNREHQTLLDALRKTVGATIR